MQRGTVVALLVSTALVAGCGGGSGSKKPPFALVEPLAKESAPLTDCREGRTQTLRMPARHGATEARVIQCEGGVGPRVTYELFKDGDAAKSQATNEADYDFQPYFLNGRVLVRILDLGPPPRRRRWPPRSATSASAARCTTPGSHRRRPSNVGTGRAAAAGVWNPPNHEPTKRWVDG